MVLPELDYIVELHANWGAFVAVNTSGQLQAWGREEYGGGHTPFPDRGVQYDSVNQKKHSFQTGNQSVAKITSTSNPDGGAFAALLEDGTAFAWGHPDFGGDVENPGRRRSNGLNPSQDRRGVAGSHHRRREPTHRRRMSSYRLALRIHGASLGRLTHPWKEFP